MISCYKNIHTPNIVEEIDIYEFVERVKSPNESTLKSIMKAREHYKKDKEQYDYLKTKLPCFTLNFSFNNRKSNENIKLPSGFIYLDIDGCTTIDFTNQFIFASWLSPSNNGRGVLVKTKGLNLSNFKETYTSIAEHLNIVVDIRAAKATQYTIHSYDKNIYFNEDSTTWLIDTTNEVKTNFTPNTSIPKEKRKDRDTLGVNQIIRYNNYDDVDYKGEKYLYFKNEKKLMATVIIPRTIKTGNRNSIISAIAYQMRALNIHISYTYLISYIKSVNLYHCKPVLHDNEITTIVKKIMSRKKITPISNNPRRFLFNPTFALSYKEKMKIVGAKNGEVRSEKTISKIENCVQKWDVTEFGKITQKSLIKVSKVSRNTIEKYYKLFKNEIAIINRQYKKPKTA